MIKFNTHPLLENRGQYSVGSVRSNTKQQATANYGGGGPSANVEMYNPIFDRLDEGSIIEDWIPRDLAGLNQMFSLMYHRDHIAGSVVDIICDLIWSDFDLVGVDDPAIKKVYYDTLTSMDIISMLPALSKEYLVMGRSIDSMIFDSKKGLFTDFISHDQSFVKITPIPIFGYDPKLDLIATPGLKKFLESTDPRDVDAKQVLPTNYIKAMSGGGSAGVPLDPITTLFLPRRAFNFDYIGTSLYTRLISFWALEKALMNTTMSAARRRASPILHVQAGLEGQWRPSDAELSEIAGLFIAADQDPVGAVVTTRNGISPQEVKSGTDLWKWSDEWEMLTQGKMRALGANDSLLSGEATYTNQETARSFLMEKANSLRDVITNRIFYKKLFPLIAKLHGFVKNSDGPLSGAKPSQREILSMPESELIMPTIRWKKDLIQESNQSKIDMLEKAEEKGVPVTIKNWASACGLDLQDQIGDMNLDSELRRRINEYKSSYKEEEFNPAVEAQKKFIDDLRKTTTSSIKNNLKGIKNELGAMNEYPFWSKKGSFCGVTAKEINKVIADIDPSSNAVRVLADTLSTKKFLIEKLKTPEKAVVAHYLLFRFGLSKLPPVLDNTQISKLSGAIDESAVTFINSGIPATKVVEIVNSEIAIVKSCSVSKKEEAMAGIQSTLDKIYSTKDNMTSKSNKLWCGV